MAKDTLHVVPHDDSWAVKREGNERSSSTHSTQKEAIDAARELLPLCPEEAVGPIKDALAQVQMLYVKEEQAGSDARAKARSQIWTPPGS